MNRIDVQIKLVIFSMHNGSLHIFAPNKSLPAEIISETETVNEQVEKIFHKHTGLPLKKHYAEQLYTFSKNKKTITIVYYVLLAQDSQQIPSEYWGKVATKGFSEQEIISYAVQRLQWKIEYTNVIYSLLPRTFTLSDLQKTYEIILGKKLDKRNFRKKILSLDFLKPTGTKRIDNARPAQIYSFTKRSPMIVKVFS